MSTSTTPLFTEEEKQQMTPNSQLLVEILEAKRAGDYEKARKLRQNLIIPAEALMAAKRSRGADWLRAQNLRLETAEAKYGKDWLDR